MPSRFLAEVPSTHIEDLGSPPSYGSSYSTAYPQRNRRPGGDDDYSNDTGYSYEDSCDDEAIGTIVPYLVKDISTTADVEDSFTAQLAAGTNTKIAWAMEAVVFESQWDYPTVLQVSEGNDTWTTEQHVIQLPTADETVYFVITTTFAQAHPIHLHGHDFWVLAQGTGTYTEGTTALTTTGAPRRDVAMLPGSGYLVIAYVTDNPGAWLLHCHIAWHTSEGFALQLLERESEITALLDTDTINSTCTNWEAYTALDNVIQDDSGV